MGDSILNGVIQRNLSNDWSVKVIKFPGATVDDLRHHALPVIRKQPKYLIVHAGTNDAINFTPRDILNKLLQLKSFIQVKLPDAEITISTPKLRPDNGKVALTAVRQLTNHLINLKIDILDKRNITGKHLSRRGLHSNQSGSNLLTNNIICTLRKFWKSLQHLSKPNRSTKSSEIRNCNNENEKVFYEDSKMYPQSPGKVSINSYEVTCSQNVYLPIQNRPSNLTKSNSNLHQVRINNPSRIIFGQINVNSIRNKFQQLICIADNEIDILMVSETKLDDTFPTSQFWMQGHPTPFIKTERQKVVTYFYMSEKMCLAK